MYSPSDLYKELATDNGRIVHSKIIVYDNNVLADFRTYTDKDLLISWEISAGDSKGFTVGQTLCKQLDLTLGFGAEMWQYSTIEVYVQFERPSDGLLSEWLLLGEFWVYKPHIPWRKSFKVRAFDKMIQLDKLYKSELTYPVHVSDILDEIMAKNELERHPGIPIFNDLLIMEPPVKSETGDSVSYYTYRDVLGFICGLNGGNGYIGRDGLFYITSYNQTNERIFMKNIYSDGLTVNGTEYEIKGFRWNRGESVDEDPDADNYGIIEFEFPLVIDYENENVAAAVERLNDRYSGYKYFDAQINKQGLGIWEVGDIVSYQDPNNNGNTDFARYLPIYICGITYACKL